MRVTVTIPGLPNAVEGGSVAHVFRLLERECAGHPSEIHPELVEFGSDGTIVEDDNGRTRPREPLAPGVEPLMGIRMSVDAEPRAVRLVSHALDALGIEGYEPQIAA